MDAEILATSAVKKRIAQTKYLSPRINEGDKEPSWDGFIYAYNKATKRKSEMFGRAAVQIKGQQKKNLRKKTTSFGMDKNDLENYRKDGGIILFVVCISADMQEKIYYKSLTPFFLNEIFEVHETRKKINIVLRELPDGEDELCNIVFNFIRDSKRQALVRDGHIWTYEEAAKLLGEGMEFTFTYTGLGYDKNDPFSYLSKNEIYMYAQNKEKTITIPMHHIIQINKEVRERNACIRVGELEYVDRIRIVQYSDGKFGVSIGKGFDFIVHEGKTEFKYHLEGNLDEKTRILETFLAMLHEKYVYIDSIRIDLFDNPEELKTIDIDDYAKRLKYFKLIKSTFDKLNVKESLEIDGLTEKEEANLHMLINAILYKVPALFKETDKIPPVCTLDFANLKILLTFHKNQDGKYVVEDFFTTKAVCVLDCEERYQTTPYCILQKEDYLHASNLVMEKVVKGFKDYENEGHLHKTVLCILEMIKAYDEDGKRTEFLKAAQNLCTWLIEKDGDNVIHRINYLQCCARERKLSNIELDELSDAVIDHASDYAIVAAAYILLGSKVMAARYIEKLDKKGKKEFEEYPIFTLFKKL